MSRHGRTCAAIQPQTRKRKARRRMAGTEVRPLGSILTVSGGCSRDTYPRTIGAQVSCAYSAPPRGRAHEASSAGGRRAVPGRAQRRVRQRGSASPPGGIPGPRERFNATIRPQILRGAVHGAAQKNQRSRCPPPRSPLTEQNLERNGRCGGKRVGKARACERDARWPDRQGAALTRLPMLAALASVPDPALAPRWCRASRPAGSAGRGSLNRGCA
jgi:hypothetical protein